MFSHSLTNTSDVENGIVSDAEANLCGLWGGQNQQQPQDLPRMASRPSQTMSGRITKAAIGSAHFTCQIALIASPAKAISDK